MLGVALHTPDSSKHATDKKIQKSENLEGVLGGCGLIDPPLAERTHYNPGVKPYVTAFLPIQQSALGLPRCGLQSRLHHMRLLATHY